MKRSKFSSLKNKTLSVGQIQKLAEAVSLDEIRKEFPGYTRAFLRQVRKEAREGLKAKANAYDRDEMVKAVNGGFMRYTKQAQIERLELQNTYYRKLAAKFQRNQAKTEAIIQAARESLSVIRPQAAFVLPKANGGNSPEDMVILLSDAQAGTEVVGKELGRFADYNMDVFRYRLRVYFRSIASIIVRRSAEFRIPKIHVWLGGDMLENENIFHTQQAFIDTNVQNQFFIVQYEIARFLASIARFGIPVEVYCTPGNHGRVASYKELNDWVNWEYVLYRMLQFVIAKFPNVKIHVPNEWYQVRRIQNRRILFIHGEDVRKWMNFPWYDLNRFYSGYSQMLEKVGDPFEDMVSGHEHVPMNLDTPKGEYIVNGSFVGATRFVVKRLRTAIPPRQRIFFVHPKMGITTHYKIHLDIEDMAVWQQTMAESYDKKVPVSHERLAQVDAFPGFCPRHPNYRGLHKPQADCEDCHRVWRQEQKK